ncbi:MAG: Gfo/Idh/MocA family oxidoreductase [Aggregatilineales bacterium]
MIVNGNTTPLRVGIIGMGWAGETHLKAYLTMPNVQVIAISDPRADHVAELGSRYNVPVVSTDYEPLLTREDLDIISVTTPNYLHAPIAIAALEHGKHVLCEKPLARTVAEAEAMVKAAIENNRVLEVAFNHRRRGDVDVLKRYIDEGGLGRIYHAKATWMRRNGIPGMGGWFTSREMAGGGPLIDLGVHVLDMAMYLLDEPEVLAVSAATYAELGPRGRGSRDRRLGGVYEVEDLATAFIRLAGGVTLLLEASWATYGKNDDDFGVSLYGTEGGATIEIKNYAWQDTLRIYTDVAGAPADIHPVVTRGEGHAGVIRDFIAAIHEGDWSAHVGREGLRRAQIIEACYRSAAEGRELALVDAATQI